MDIKLSDEQRTQLCQKVVTMYLDEFDEEISDFRAEQILDAFIERIGPSIYNTAVEDVKHYLLARLEDVDAILRKK